MEVDGANQQVSYSRSNTPFDPLLFFKNFFNRFPSIKKFITPFIILFLLVGVFFTIQEVQKRQEGRGRAFPDGALLSMQTNSPTISAGQTVTVDVLLDTRALNVTAVQLAIKPTSASLQILSITPVTTTFPEILKKQGDPDGFVDANGVAHTSVGSGTNGGKNGSSILVATMQVQASQGSSGPVQLVFDNTAPDNITQVAAQGQDVTVLDVASPLSLTIGGVQQGVDLSLATTTPVVTPGSLVAITVAMNTNIYNVTAADITLTYPSSQFDLDNIVHEPSLWAPFSTPPVQQAGKANIAVSIKDPNQPFNGTTTFVTLTLRAKDTFTQSTAIIDFNSNTLIAAEGNRDTNVVGTMSPLTLTLGGPISPTNTPTGIPPTITPTPPTVRIQGSHVNASGAPFTTSGQTITITNLATMQTQTTQASPNWSFTNLPRAAYRIEASPIAGYLVASNLCAECTFHPNYSSPIFIDFNFSQNLQTTFVDVGFQYIPTATNTPTPTTVQQPTATPTLVPNHTYINVSVRLPAIGTRAGDNRNPQNTTRNATIILGDADGNDTTVNGVLTFNGTTFSGNIDLGQNFLTDVYDVKVQVEKTLYKRYPRIYQIITNEVTTLPQLDLVTGEIDNSSVNEIDLSDYNRFILCFAQTCTTSERLERDLNDDGRLDQVDYNILLVSFVSRIGD